MADPPARPVMNRRLWITAALLALPGLLPFASGCSSGGKSAKNKSRSGSPMRRMKRPKGPKTMTNLLLDSYIDDLKNGSAEKKIYAAKELGSMGSNAKSALSALQALKGDSNPKVAAAAADAIRAISK